jgi:hypothetical protein
MSSKISKVRQFQGVARKESDDFRVDTPRRLRAESEQRAKASATKRKRAGDDSSDGDEPANDGMGAAQYKKFMRKAQLDTLQLAVPQLTGKERMLEEARLARAQGALPLPKQKIGRREAFAQHEQFKREAAEKRIEAQQNGVYVKGATERERKEAEYEKHRRLFDFSGMAHSVGSGERALKVSIGRSTHDGMLLLSKRDIERVSNPSKFTAKRSSAAAPAQRGGGGGGRGSKRGGGRGGKRGGGRGGKRGGAKRR